MLHLFLWDEFVLDVENEVLASEKNAAIGSPMQQRELTMIKKIETIQDDNSNNINLLWINNKTHDK